MDNISTEDIRQLFQGCACLYKGRPVYVFNVGGERTVHFYDMVTQKRESVKFSLKDFMSPLGRLGMVNVLGSVVWTFRIPIRRYSVGLSNENFKIQQLDMPYYPAGSKETVARISQRNCPELAECLRGEYYDILDAYAIAKDYEGAAAFDKQFAVDCDSNIYFKTEKVGYLDNPTKGIEGIEFTKRFEYLETLLGGKYVKGSGNFRFKKN